MAQSTESFEAFYRREVLALSAVARALVGDPSVAADLTQECLVRTLRAWPKVSGYDRPGAWARRVLLNLITDHHRRAARDARRLRRLLPLSTTIPSSNAFDVSAEDRAVWDAVRDLPTRQSQVVALHYVDDLSVDAIAALLDISPGTVKTTLFNARAALAARLRLEEEDHDHA